MNNLKSNINDIKKVYESRKSDDDTRMQTRDNLRKQFAEFDNLLSIDRYRNSFFDYTV